MSLNDGYIDRHSFKSIALIRKYIIQSDVFSYSVKTCPDRESNNIALIYNVMLDLLGYIGRQRTGTFYSDKLIGNSISSVM